MIELAIERGIVTASDKVLLMNWSKDPANWTGI
jgi:hypothetical protein